MSIVKVDTWVIIVGYRYTSVRQFFDDNYAINSMTVAHYF